MPITRMMDGDRYITRASAVQSWMVSTAAGRRRNIEQEIAAEDDVKALRRELGVWEGD